MKLRNLLVGMRSILDLFPHRRAIQLPSIKTDKEALASDWQKVGDDMRGAMGQIDKETDDA